MNDAWRSSAERRQVLSVLWIFTTRLGIVPTGLIGPVCRNAVSSPVFIKFQEFWHSLREGILSSSSKCERRLVTMQSLSLHLIHDIMLEIPQFTFVSYSGRRRLTIHGTHGSYSLFADS